MTIRELCKYINITTPTLYNWKQEKPNLYKIIENFNKQEQNMLNKKHKELINIFDKLTEKEQEYYLADMKTRILQKEIE